MVNATKANGWLFMQNNVYCKFYAIYRRATAAVGFYPFKQVYFLEAQWVANGDGVSHATLGLIGGHYHNAS
jgi:hypothetical protein